MRTIKFRAWDKDYSPERGQMIYWESESGDFFWGVAYKLPLMQFTGLLDKNGKEIYEGDVVKYYHHPNDVAVIKFNEDLLTHQVTIVSEGVECEDYFFTKSDSSAFEIIGNIYENPELLK